MYALAHAFAFASAQLPLSAISVLYFIIFYIFWGDDGPPPSVNM
jgi:hypothetical protein